MKKRITAFVLCLLLMASMIVPPAYAMEDGNDYSGNVGKYAQLNPYYAGGYVFIHDGSSDFAITEALPVAYEEFEEGLIFKITNWYWDSINSAVWYQVETYQGALPEDVPSGTWILQNYTEEEYKDEDTLLFVTVEPTQDETTVTVEGILTNEYTMEKYEKPLLEASSTLTGVVSYRWQILVDREADMWVDIYNQTESALSLSYAMVKTLLNSENQAWVRCISSADGQEVISEAFCVTVYEPVEEMELLGETEPTEETEPVEETEPTEETEPVEETDPTEETEPVEETEPTEETEPEEETDPTEETELVEEAVYTVEMKAVEPKMTATAFVNENTIDTEDGIAPAAEGDELPPEETEEDQSAKKYILSILYVYGSESIHVGTAVAPAWSAEISPQQEYNGTIESPEFPGYTPDQENVNFTYPAGTLTSDVQITVYYNPAEVAYTVLHRWQNINDDQYSDYEIETKYGKTESLVPNNLGKKDNGDPLYDGLEPLPYVIDRIAADGTTMVEVRHDRIYYLMTFELSGGYGTYPIYARYGTALTVPNPTRPGYTFLGWDKLDENGNGDGVADTLPATMPHESSSYKALWKAAGTTYSVAYWIVNDDGTTTFMGSRTDNAQANTTVSGNHDDVGTEASGGYAICGSHEHTHSDACYVCNASEHAHTFDCFGINPDTDWNVPDSNGEAVIAAVGDGNPESGYVYVIRVNDTGALWPKLYLDGYYYTIKGIGAGNTDASQEQVNSIIEGPALGTGTYGNLTATKYRPKSPCGIVQHIHSDACRTCEEHTHSDNCYQDDKYLVDVDTITIQKNGEDVTYTTDTNVTVAGNGSSVVNVYYQFKEYTLKFYYAASTGSGTNTVYKILGGTSYYFGSWGTDTSDDEQLLEDSYGRDNGIHWGTVSALPTLNERGEDKEYTKGSVTYNYNNTPVTYYYISFQARYGDDISQMWPCAVFNSATRTQANTHGNWSGKEAFVSAWNGEHHVRYSQVNANQTIKGVYEKLDENLLFHSLFPDESEVSYICFWENGANIGWSVPELYRYNIYLEVRTNQDITGLTTVTKNDGKTYYLAEFYDTCDDSFVDQQTHASITGYQQKTFGNNSHSGYSYVLVQDSNPAQYFEYRELTGTTNETQLTQSGYYDSRLYKEGYEVNFYYTCNKNNLKFWNHSNWLGEGKGAGNTQEGEGVQYGTPLIGFGNHVDAEFMAQPENYPKNLEKDAYYFDGWYTTPLCLDGSEMDWSGTMPDADITVYAKWSPKHHVVNVYHHKNTDGSFPTDPADILLPGLSVTHGTLVPEDQIPQDPPDTEALTFDGWFYLDENGAEQAFDFYNIPVTKDLNIYAKWKSNQLRDVTIRYVTEVDGKDVEIAAPETFSGYVGDSKTYEAKTENQLYEGYRTKYYPKTASSSITVSEDERENVLIFRYVFIDSPPYTVEYWIKDEDGTLRPAFPKNTDGSRGEFVGNTVITEAEMYKKTVTGHGLAVVTENYIPAQQYIPDQLQKRLIISATESENVIKFIYTYSPDSAIYVVNHYVVKPGVIVVDGPEDYDLNSHEEFTGNVGSSVLANPGAVFGAEFSESITVAQNPSTEGYIWDSTTKTLSVTLKDDNTTTLDFFYVPIECEYRVLYIDEDTGAELGRKVGMTAQYGETVTEIAEAIAGYMVDENEKSIVIQAGTAAANTITFYYTRKTGDIQISKEVKLDDQQAQENPNLVLPEGEENRKFEFTILATDSFHKNQFDYTITHKNGTVETGTVSVKDNLFKELGPIQLGNGDQIVVHGLSLGEYTVKETHVIGYKTTVRAVETEAMDVTLDTHGEKETVDFVNTYPFFTGDLILSKTIQKADETDPDGSDEIFTYTITVTPADGTLEEDRVIKFKDRDSEGAVIDNTYTIPAGGYGKTYEFSLRLKAGTTVTVEDIPEGEIRVWETIDEDHYATPYYKVSYTKENPAQDTTPGNSSVVLTKIFGGHNTTVEYTNTYKKDKLTIQKTVTQESQYDTLDQDTFTFVVTGETKLPDGTYQILIDGAAGTATVAGGQVTISANPQITVTGTGTADLLIENLPAGTYAVRETDAENGLDAYIVSDEVTGLQLTGTGDKRAEFTNTFKRGKGNLYLEKVLVAASGYNPDELPTDTLFSFTITLTEDVPEEEVKVQVAYSNGTSAEVTLNNGSLTVQLKANEHVTITGLPVGKYRITEATVPSYANQFALKDAEDAEEWVPQPSTSTDDGALYLDLDVNTNQTTEVKCTNIYPIDRAELVIQKLVTKEYDRDTLPDDGFEFTITLAEEDLEEYSYTVYDQDGTKASEGPVTVDAGNAFRITLKAGQYVVVPNMPVCGYTVTESVDSQHYNMSYQVYQTEVGETASTEPHTAGEVLASGEGGTMTRTFVAGKVDTVVFTNQYKKHLTNLTIDRNAAADSEQVFVYEVKNNTTGDIITVTVVGNGETTIYDLPYGDYTVTQRNDWSWRYGDASKTITLSADDNEEGQAATVVFDGSASAKWLDGFSQLIRNIYPGGGVG